MSSTYQLFAVAPRNTEDLLAAEVSSLGASEATPRPGGVAFRGDLAVAYRVRLWSRVASRVLLTVAEVPATSAAALREAVAALSWTEHLSVDSTFLVYATGTNEALKKTTYAALVVKDGVADHFYGKRGRRPSVDTARPGVQLHLHIHRDTAVVSVDLSGESLHRRGYRTGQGKAPLKENVAAAALLRARWPRIAAEGGGFVDPMCGSGTIPIEAALMAADIAPGLLRPRGLDRWSGHEGRLWQALLREAEERRKSPGLTLTGYDADPGAVRLGRENVRKAGLADLVSIRAESLEELRAPAGVPGLVLTNPPYGRRLGGGSDLRDLYARLGSVLHERFRGWSASVLTADRELSYAIGLRAQRVSKLYNGAVECTLAHFALTGDDRERITPRARRQR